MPLQAKCLGKNSFERSMIRRLKAFNPPATPGKLPQCCTPVAPPSHDPDWRRQHHPDIDHTRCALPGVVEIDGKPYCRRHGGMEALDRWLDGRLVEPAKEGR